MDVYKVMQEMKFARKPFAVATVIETLGSSSAKTASKAVIDSAGHIVIGWVGGGCAESAVRQTALDCIASGETTIMDIDLNEEVLGAGMPCGGSMRVYIEPVLPQPTLWILGHGSIAEALSTLGVLMDLRVVVNDVLAEHGRYPGAESVITDDRDYERLSPERGDFVVIATQHKGDHESMKRALSLETGYIALIASKKRTELVLDYLRKEGFTEDALSHVRAPAGIEIGAHTPEEIALSVMSEITLVRRGGLRSGR